MNAARLLEYFDRIAEAPNAVPRLRNFILDLAVRGKLVEQDPNDEPASELLKKIRSEKNHLLKPGKSVRLASSSIQDNEAWPYSVPKNWVWVSVVETVSAHYGGGTPSKNNHRYWGGDIFWASVKDIGKDKFIDGTIDKITEDGLKNSSSNLIPPWHLLIVTRMGLGKISINRVPIAINQDIRALSPSVFMDISYQYIFFKTHGFEGTGLTVKGIKVEELMQTSFPLPPLAEQHRIVAKVDELMALCDRLKASQAKRESRRDRLASASLKRIGQPEDVGNGEEFRENVRFHLRHLPRLATRPVHVKELRQAILNLAVRGKLVPQEKNEATERSKLTKYVVEERKLSGFRQGIPSEDFESLGIDILKYNFPASWEVMKLSEIALIIVDCPHSTPRWVESGVLCVRTNQFKPGFLDLSASRYVSSETYVERIQRLEPKYDDVLYSREGGILGVACRVPEDIRLCLGQRMMLFRMSSVYLPKFAELVLNSPLITELARQNTTGGAAPRVNVALIKSYPMPVPSLAEQQRIVAKVDELMKLCDQLEVHLATNQTNQSRLLEATLCDALGVTCLPVSRPNRPAPSPARGAATYSEQPPKPIVARPVPVETLKAAVQGSLIEQPTPQVGKPRAANGDIPGAILAQMQPGQEYSRAQLAEALGLSVYEWNMAIRELKESGRVVQAGERRGARYSVTI